MAVATTATFELTIAQIITRAYHIAGLYEATQSPRSEDIAMARDLLNMEMLELQAEGVVQADIMRTTLALSAGTAEYALDSDCVDVYVGPDNSVGTMTAPGSTTETRVFAMSRNEYQETVDKTVQALPLRAFVDKALAMRIAFWPAPSLAYTFRYSKLRLSRDANPTTVTADASRKRQLALVWALAFQLAVAKKMTLERCGFLRNERDRLKAVAKADDVERGHAQLWVI